MYSLHNHTEYSNASCGFSDSVNHLEKLIKRAKEYELKGIAITDHELLGGHYKAQQIGKKMGGFKVILGNEIYLQSPEEHYDIINKINKEKPVYPHFILQALDKEGHKQLRELTTEAWKRAYTHGGIIRRPTLTSDIEKIIGGNQGHVVAQTACLGSTFSRLLLELINAQDKDMQNIKMKIHTFVQWNLQVFGSENFFIEIHPVNAHEENVNQEQLSYNLKAIEIANAYGIPYIVATDSHFLSKEDFKVQSAFLNSKDGDREVDLFYKTAYLMRENEVREYMNTHLTQEQVDTAIKNTRLIGDRVEDFDLSHKIMIPLTKLPKFEMNHYFSAYYDKYKYIKIFAESEKEQDRYLMYQIEKGIKEKLKVGEDCEESLDRINTELREFHEISQIADIDFSAYYNTMANIIEIIWTEGDSLVAVGRGSSGAFLLCYLLGITQINPLPLGDLMPHWRHLSKERGIDPPDWKIYFLVVYSSNIVEYELVNL